MLLNRGLWGDHRQQPSPDFLTRWLFLRGLGVIYLIAFISLWVQVTGLIGNHGILPASDLMTQAERVFETNNIGLDRYRQLPTLCWLSSTDTSLKIQCALGTALALALIAGLAQPIALIGLWILYLSLVTVGQEFLSFQWDYLLLETGLLAIFFAPWKILPRPSREKPPSRAILWALRILLFKLMFLSGVVKLTSGDPLWRNLTALSRHYETQPIPNVIAWYFHLMPMWFHKTSCVMMFAVELLAPFLLFAPRRPRLLGAIAIASLQLFILLTGNFTFFNWLTIVLCIVACDDFTLKAILPSKLSNHYNSPPTKATGWTNLPSTVIAVFAIVLSMSLILSALGASLPMMAVYRWLAPFGSFNRYGLFAVMTPDRPEIIVEGSNDRVEWKEYSFRYKPGALNRRPPFVAPHQPRLDWQMWFAALGDARSNPWFVNFCVRLLQGSPEVLALMDKNPFPTAPPKYIRARLYDYKFTTHEERRLTGNWWKCELKGEYLPPISLDMLEGVPGK